MEPTIDSDEMQVWYVSPDENGKNNRVVFNDPDAMRDYAHDVLDALLDRMDKIDDDEDGEVLYVERRKITREEWEAIGVTKEEATNDQP